MNANATIIDVKPLEFSSTREHAQDSRTAYAAAGDASGYRRREPVWGKPSTWQDSPHSQSQTHHSGAPSFDPASVGNERTSTSPFSALGGLAQVVIGAGLVAIGIPMLIVPGPGFFAMTAGTLLIAHGLSERTR